MDDKLPEIVVTPGGPLIVKDLKKLIGPDGKYLKTKPQMALCRCGASKKKPFCDSAHAKIDFIGAPSKDRLPNRVKEYAGASLTVVDNRAFCSHDGACISELPQVFSTWARPWIQPDKAAVKRVMDICQRCPSGALSYIVDGKLHDSVDRPPGVSVEAYGPYNVVGSVKLTMKEDSYYPPQCREHYSLCRCGISSNPPYCDGSHFQVFSQASDPWG